MSLEDKYETLEKIGHGSFGIIRKVRRKADGFIMCRKEISYLRMSQKEREQLHAEFQILSHLRHPHIVAYYHREHLKASQDLHLYMEYCGNGDLGRVIKDLQLKGQRAQESFVWSIFSQLVLALYRCHYGIDPPEVGGNVLGITGGNAPKTPAGAVTILHRDLKPENVFLGEDNSVKLGDFGLSKMIKSQDFASTYVGTPFYMSPEICAAEKYTLKSDIWSLGCIIYELCAREPPFNAKTHYQLVQKIKDGKINPLPDMYSPELNQVIKDCLKVNPDRRPDTAQLLNLPVVKLMRKEKEVVDLNKALKAREEILREKETELNLRLVNLDKEKHLMRQEMREEMREEIDASIRREWEGKARLEIDRQISVEVEKLKKQFDEEGRKHVERELGRELESRRKRAASPPTEEVQNDSPRAKSEHAHTSSADGSGDEFPSTTDITELSYTAVESPDIIKEVKRTARTPYGRAQTFAGHMSTPMDIEMTSPDPMALATLSLSPRRRGKARPPTHQGNIFAANATATSNPENWERDGASLDSDDEDITPPSPTRHRSSRNPFTSKNRPILSSQKTSSVAARIRTSAGTSSGFVSKVAVPPAQTSSRTRSPVSRLNKVPSVANLGLQNTVSEANTPSPISSSSSSLSRRISTRKDAADAHNKVAKNNLKGRTLVELQQARAGGRPMSVSSISSVSGVPLGENVSPKRSRGTAYRDRVVSSGHEPVAVWDPERDEMPSPFLDRRRIARV